MIYEFRTYIAAPGKLPALLERFCNHTIRLFGKHGIASLGYWTSDNANESDYLMFLLRFENAARREAAWAAFQADPEWQAIRAATNKDGNLVREFRYQVLHPTDFSLLK